MMKNCLLATSAALWIALSPVATASEIPPADEAARKVTARILDEVSKRQAEFRENPEAMYGFVNDVILPNFDFRYMSQLVLARNWRSATPEQRDRFQQAFRNLLVRTYSNALLEYSDEKIEFKPLRAAKDADIVTIRSDVIRKGSPPIPINYDVRLRDNEWKVFDVTVDGVSLVTNYRGTFSSEIRRDGLDALIARLEKDAVAVKP